MKDDYTVHTINSHYLTYTFFFKLFGRMYFLNLGVKGLTYARHDTWRIPVHKCISLSLPLPCTFHTFQTANHSDLLFSPPPSRHLSRWLGSQRNHPCWEWNAWFDGNAEEVWHYQATQGRQDRRLPSHDHPDSGLDRNPPGPWCWGWCTAERMK